MFAPPVREVSKMSVEKFTNTLEPFTTGPIMPNFINADEGLERDQAAYLGLKTMRLAMLKSRFDPMNILRFARTPGLRPA
jgi:hypothetical protein